MLLQVYRQHVKPEDMHFPQTEKDVKKNRTFTFERQKTCAIIGSSGILLNSSCGREIDKHDFVIRTNLGTIDGYEKDVGKQTDLTSMNWVVVCDILQEMSDNKEYEKKRKKFHFQSHLHRIKNLKGSTLWYTLPTSSLKQKKELLRMVEELNLRGINYTFAYSPDDPREMTKW